MRDPLPAEAIERSLLNCQGWHGETSAGPPVTFFVSPARERVDCAQRSFCFQLFTSSRMIGGWSVSSLTPVTYVWKSGARNTATVINCPLPRLVHMILLAMTLDFILVRSARGEPAPRELGTRGSRDPARVGALKAAPMVKSTGATAAEASVGFGREATAGPTRRLLGRSTLPLTENGVGS